MIKKWAKLTSHFLHILLGTCILLDTLLNILLDIVDLFSTHNCSNLPSTWSRASLVLLEHLLLSQWQQDSIVRYCIQYRQVLHTVLSGVTYSIVKYCIQYPQVLHTVSSGIAYSIIRYCMQYHRVLHTVSSGIEYSTSSPNLMKTKLIKYPTRFVKLLSMLSLLMLENVIPVGSWTFLFLYWSWILNTARAVSPTSSNT